METDRTHACSFEIAVVVGFDVANSPLPCGSGVPIEEIRKGIQAALAAVLKHGTVREALDCALVNHDAEVTGLELRTGSDGETWRLCDCGSGLPGGRDPMTCAYCIVRKTRPTDQELRTHEPDLG